MENEKTFKKEIFANTSFEETRIAVLENGMLSEVFWERKSNGNIVGNIYKGVVENVLPGISSAFINIGLDKNAYIYISDVIGDKKDGIEKVLKKGQEIMVQVTKDAISTKGMKVTMDISLPGRYLVLTPFQEFVGVSKNIEREDERKRLSEIIKKISEDVKLEKMGCIVRTEAEGATEEELFKEIKYLMRVYDSINKKYQSNRAPYLLKTDLSLSMQIARDILSKDVEIYMLDNKEEYNNVVEFISKLSPELKERIKYYDNKTPIFKAFNIEEELNELRKVKVELPNGGSIIIQEAESLCAIDVNTGRYTGNRSQEETVTQTNIEAAYEIARHLRLRNIGGIVVIDFIDMRKASNRHKVVRALEDAVRRDRAKIKIFPITRLGLVEMSRERKRESTVSMLTDECPQCHGSGRVLSSESIRIKIQKDIQNLTADRPGGNLRVLVNPLLGEVLKEKHNLIEKNIHRVIKIQTDPQISWEDYRIVLE